MRLHRTVFIAPYPATALKPWRNFQGRKHYHFGEKGFEQAAQMEARRGGAEQDGRGLRHLISGQLTQAIENAADKGGLQSGAGGGRRLRVEGAAEFLFDVVIEGEHAQAAVVGKQRADEGAAERLAWPMSVSVSLPNSPARRKTCSTVSSSFSKQTGLTR